MNPVYSRLPTQQRPKSKSQDNVVASKRGLACNLTMGNILGKEKPLKEVMRENKRTITRAIRELDREKVGLEKEEKRLTMEIKKAAKENQMQSVKVMAKVSDGGGAV